MPDEARALLVGQDLGVEELAVDAQADVDAVAQRVEVNVGGALANGVAEEGVGKAVHHVVVPLGDLRDREAVQLEHQPADQVRVRAARRGQWLTG